MACSTASTVETLMSLENEWELGEQVGESKKSEESEREDTDIAKLVNGGDGGGSGSSGDGGVGDNFADADESSGGPTLSDGGGEWGANVIGSLFQLLGKILE